jgi:hypothetical protein
MDALEIEAYTLAFIHTLPITLFVGQSIKASSFG